MLLAEEKMSDRTTTTCLCGRKAELQVGTRTFFIGPKKILLHNVPHFYCSYCNKASYDSKLNIDDLLKYAFRNNMDEIDWNNTRSYL